MTAHRLAAHGSSMSGSDEATTAVIVVRAERALMMTRIDEGGSTGTHLIPCHSFVPHTQIFSAAAVILAVYFGVLKCCYGSYSLTTVVREYKKRRRLEEVSESRFGSIG